IEDAFINRIANTIAHEIGHDLGSIHLRSSAQKYANGSLMGSGEGNGPAGKTKFAGPLKFGFALAPIVKFAMGLPVKPGKFEATYLYYKTFIKFETGTFHDVDDGQQDVDDGQDEGELALGAPRLVALAGPLQAGDAPPDHVAHLDLGLAVADGPGGNMA